MWTTTAFLTIALLASPGIQCSSAESRSDISVSGNRTAAAVLEPVAFEDAGPKANLMPKAVGGFSRTCSNIQLVGCSNGLSLAAICGNGNGGSNGWTYLPINSCFANLNGTLVGKQNGNAMLNGSCDSCSLQTDAPNRMDCRCFRINGSADWTTVNLDDCVTNQNGNLIC
ncbi:hypothetical protein AURDEDRAFT_164497 [Auricularia subglabra TFB-10046 SS5]|nr:hypothetical protein AURDEDRAFT_164497 [Auricularia subglabra TFB-10046 SS5]